MSTATCTISQNQPIYQALIAKAASYPTDKIYQSKAYKYAAESVRICNYTLYNDYMPSVPGVGYKIAEFIDNFIRTEVFPTTTMKADPAAKAMDDARKIAALNAPSTSSSAVLKAIIEAPIDQPLTAQQIVSIVKEEMSKVDEQDLKLKQQRQDARAAQRSQRREERAMQEKETPKTALDFYYESLMKPIVYTAENPRRSSRLAKKPKVEYFINDSSYEDYDNDFDEDSDEEYIDEQDEIAKAIQTLCKKKGWDYSDDMPAEFEKWLPTDNMWAKEKYDYKTQAYTTQTKSEMAKYWTKSISTSIKKQVKDIALCGHIIKYCKKNNIHYDPIMNKKLADWMDDPANKKIITVTYTRSSRCTCSTCDPTGSVINEKKEYTHERSAHYCVNAWFSTLKKTIIW